MRINPTMFDSKMLKVLGSLLSTLLLLPQRWSPAYRTCLILSKHCCKTQHCQRKAFLISASKHADCLADRLQEPKNLRLRLSVMMHSKKPDHLIKTTLGDGHHCRKQIIAQDKDCRRTNIAPLNLKRDFKLFACNSVKIHPALIKLILSSAFLEPVVQNFVVPAQPPADMNQQTKIYWYVGHHILSERWISRPTSRSH